MHNLIHTDIFFLSNGLLIQWGYKDMTSDVVCNITNLISYTSANSYTILTSVGSADNTQETWTYPLGTYNRSVTSFSIYSKGSVNNGRLNYFCIGY